MVAPLIVGAVRIAGGRAMAGSKAAARRGQIPSKRAPHTEAVGTQKLERQKQLEYQRKIQDLTEDEDGQNSPERIKIRQALAAITGYPIIWAAVTFYVIQLLFWFIGLAGLGIELVPLLKEVTPGLELLLISHLIIAAFGTTFMVYAYVMFKRRFIDCSSGVKMLIFLGCLTGYWIFFFNLIPWVIVWVICVIILQKKHGGDDDESEAAEAGE